MNVISVILKHSRQKALLPAGIGCCAGIGTAALMALINLYLKKIEYPTQLFLWAFVGLGSVLIFCNLISRFALIDLSQRLIFDLRMGLCGQLLNVPLRQLEQIGAHRIMATLTQDIPAIEAALLAFPMFCINVSMALSCMAYLCWLSPSIFAAFSATIIVITIGVEWIQKKAGPHIKLAREEWNTLVGHFRALSDGSKELKIHRRRRQAFLSEMLKSSAEVHRKHNVRGRQLTSISSVLAQMFYFIFTGLLLFALPALWNIDQGTLIAYTLIVLFVRTPLVFIIDVIPVFNSGNLALKQVADLGLSLAPANSECSETKNDHQGSGWNRLELVGITHSYRHEREDDQFILGPIDLVFRPGELVFLVGGNGSGKTTLAKLITNLYTPETGEVRFDSELVTEKNRDNIRQLFSVVFSPPFLFERLLGLDAVNLDRQAQDYLVKLHLDYKVQIKDGVLSTTELSQGQRKRLALLTAYLEDRPICVFDEWAADQDPLFKEVFYLQLLPELKAKGKMVLVISHDDKYYHLADRIIVLESGRVMHDGNANSEYTRSAILR
jgi:putative ATP-binding cassette transporter